jgi:hypothetical protein
MKDFKNMAASFGRVFVVAIMIKFMDLGADVFALNMESLRHLFQAGMVSLIPVAIRYFNPNDESFGVKKEEAKDGN